MIIKSLVYYLWVFIILYIIKLPMETFLNLRDVKYKYWKMDESKNKNPKSSKSFSNYFEMIKDEKKNINI